jgi:hypothetical protein
MRMPDGTYTIPEAASLWICMVRSRRTAGTEEAKDGLVAWIKSSAPLVADQTTPRSFAAATNEIKAIIRAGHDRVQAQMDAADAAVGITPEHR